MAIHRKVHLFDIDIPGKITFKVGGLVKVKTRALTPSSGERDPHWRHYCQLLRHGYAADTWFCRPATSYVCLEFARIGLGICYDVRFPELAMINARKGSLVKPRADYGLTLCTGCQVLIYPGAFNLTTGPLHWELLQRAR